MRNWTKGSLLCVITARTSSVLTGLSSSRAYLSLWWPVDGKQNCFEWGSAILKRVIWSLKNIWEGNQGDNEDVDLQWVKRAETRFLMWCFWENQINESHLQTVNLVFSWQITEGQTYGIVSAKTFTLSNLLINLFIYRSTALAVLTAFLWTLPHWLHSLLISFWTVLWWGTY